MISVVFCGDLRYCPYLARYTERLNEAQTEYEVLFWNRSSLKVDVPENYKFYGRPSAENLGKVKKLADFWEFRRWVKKRLAVSRPDGIIFLSTLSGVFLWDVAKRYRKKYIFDIRDYSYEHIAPFLRTEKTIIRDSFFTAISSKGFLDFLPEYDYVIAHNFNRSDMTESFLFERQPEPYPIVWNGTVRYFDYQKKFLDVFKNDPRYLMVYHGTGAELDRYKEYCRENGITNVRFTGPYDNRDKGKLVRNAAFLNNCYGGGSVANEVKYAVSNRFYDGLVYHIPQIVECGGYKGDETKRLGVGFCAEPTEDLPDRLWEYYRSFDARQFDKACECAIREILQEDDLYIQKIDDFINYIEKREC